MTGSLSVLNTGAGDIVVSFNEHDDAETDRAIAMLLDMQKRGYAILVRQDDGSYARAIAINKETKSYVVMPPAVETIDEAAEPTLTPKRRGLPRKKVEQPVRSRRAVGVARSAGGCARRSPMALLARARIDVQPRVAREA
jgi:hypothetical protein